MRKIIAILSVIASAAVFAADIVKDGKPIAEIILVESPDQSIKVAAEEVQKYIEKMSGAKLDIVPAPTGKYPTRIYVGESDFTRKLGFSLKDVKYDGYKIRVKGDDIIIAGIDIDWYNNMKLSPEYLDKVNEKWKQFTGHAWRSPMFIYSIESLTRTNPKLEFYRSNATGTLYGAYHFLEQFGFRWYFSFPPPDEDLGKVIPQSKNLVLKDQEIKREPEFAIRDYPYWVCFRDDALWVKSQGVGMFEQIVPVHLTGRMLDYHEDPELAGKVNGKTDWKVPKLSSPKFREMFMHYLDCFNRFYPVRMPFTSFGSPDGWAGLDDQDVADGWDKFKTRGANGRFSDYYWDFILDIRERYNKKYPFGESQRKHVYAYSGTKRIPEKLDKIPEDFTIYFCHNSNSVHLPGGDYRPELKEWQAKITDIKQLVVYDYYYDHTMYKGERPAAPYIFTENLKTDFDMMYGKCNGWLLEGMIGDNRGNKFRGFYRPAINCPMFYLRNKMSWSRNCDPGKELDDLCERYYGPAAKEMRELYTYSEQMWMRPVPRQVTAAGGYIKKDDVPILFDLLEKAKAKAGNDTIYARRIAMLESEMAMLKDVFAKLERKGPEVRANTFTDGDQPNVNGDLTKTFWQWKSRTSQYGCYPLKDMITGEVPSHISTTAQFRFVGNTLYIGIECLEPKMAKIQARTTERDDFNIWKDDMVEICLETVNGRKPVINVNPNGAVYDQDPTLPNAADLPTFYTVKACAVKKLADRWTVELAIDFTELEAVRPGLSSPCGIQIGRQRLAGNTVELYMLSPTGSRFNDHPEMMGKMFVR